MGPDTKPAVTPISKDTVKNMRDAFDYLPEAEAKESEALRVEERRSEAFYCARAQELEKRCRVLSHTLESTLHLSLEELRKRAESGGLGAAGVPPWSPTMASPGRTATPPQLMTPLHSHGCIAAGPCFGVVEWLNVGNP